MLDVAHKPPGDQIALELAVTPLSAFIFEGKIVITSELAARILREARFAGQDARLRAGEINKQVMVLETLMRRGLFRDGSQISFVRCGNRIWLVNGYHRLTALVLHGRSIEFRVAVDEIASEADVAVAFHHFDRNQFDRTDAQVLSALGVAEKHKMSKTAATACWAAVAFINNDMKPPRASTLNAETSAINRVVDLRSDSAEPWWPHAARLDEALRPALTRTRQKLFGGARFAVALLTMRYQPATSWEFWDGLGRDDGLRVGDPRKTLLKDLETRKIAGGEAEIACAQVAHAWNSFFRGRTCQAIRDLEQGPLRILGTPFDQRTA